jgi:uncharacterized membrane protein (UPF0127 family)
VRPLRLLLLALVLATGLLGCHGGDASDGEAVARDIAFRRDGTLTFVRADGSPITTIDVEIAETDSARARGLMGRRRMGYDRGMLFLFDEPNTNPFWMRDTPMPLDIVFVAPDSEVVNIARRTMPFSDERVHPAAPKQFVVEVRAGFADRYGLTDSTRIRWTRSP